MYIINHLVIPTFPCFSHLSQQGHALIHRHQTGRFRRRGRRCLSPLQPALGVEGHRSQSSRGAQRRQASDAKNVVPWEHLGRKWRKSTVFVCCVSGFSLVFSGLFSKLRKTISWSFLILSPLGTGRNDKNMVGKWWMYVGQEPCKKKNPSGNLMSPYEGFFGDVRCELLRPWRPLRPLIDRGLSLFWPWNAESKFLLIENAMATLLWRMQLLRLWPFASRLAKTKERKTKARFLGKKKKHHFSRDWETPNTHSQVQRLRPQASSSSSLSNLPAWGGVAIPCCLWEGATKCPFGMHFGWQVSSVGLIPEARCVVSIFVRVLAEGFATQHSSPIPILHIKLLMYCNNLHSCTIIPIISHQCPN